MPEIMQVTTPQTEKLSSAIGFSDRLLSLKGPIEFTFLNDVVFHLAMERSPMISLRGLISDLMEIPFRDITDVQVLNPIMQAGPKGKKIILDVLVEVNHSRRINIELQTWKDAEWINRSLYYLCREFSNINNGDDYSKIKPATHISIMTYTIFPDEPEFYARYQLLNIENHRLYTPHFGLNVLDLSKDSLATDRDRRNHLDFWSKLFKCTTWEEVRTLAAKGPIYKEVAESMAISNIDPKESDWVREHIRYVSGMRGSFTAGQESRQEEIDAISAKLSAVTEERDAVTEKLDTITEERDAVTEKLDTVTEERDALRRELAASKARIKELESRDTAYYAT